MQLAESGSLWIHIAISVQRVFLGFAIGAVTGLAVAAVVGLTRAGDALLSPTLAAIRAVPSLALVPLLLLWMGIGEESKVTLIAIGAFFPVFTTVSLALRQVDARSVEMARSFSLRGFALFRTRAAPGRRARRSCPVSGSPLRRPGSSSSPPSSSPPRWVSAGCSQTPVDNGRVDRILLAIVLLALLGTLTNGILSIVQKYLLRRWI